MRKPSHLIINNPYNVPGRHWRFDRQRDSFDLIPERRQAGYVQSTPRYQGTEDPGVFVPIELVNLIRPRVDAWRQGGYQGATAVTRALLDHWNDPEARELNKRFFFCQLEAIETLIWLTEAPPAERVGIAIPGDGGPFRRLCSKMATGSGKTIVMAMIAAWQVLNKAANNQDARFSKHLLIVAPGLTVRKRLAVLMPAGEGNYYDLFSIIPDSLMPLFRAHAKVAIINWHKLAWETEEKIAKRKGVDKRGPKSDDAWLRAALGELAKARNIVVLNDEAHHAWRITETARRLEVSRDEKEAATKWIAGLDRIHGARGILNCFDLSATPFVPAAQVEDDALFKWIVSDFGLNDAIESGLVKTPRVVIRDDAIPSAQTYKSKLYHIYKAIDAHGSRLADDLNRDAEPEESLPQLVMNAYLLLGKDWLETSKDWAKKGQTIPPVMITVANRIETAARVKYAFDHQDILLPELCVPELTLQIDSKELGKAEAQEEAISLARSEEDDDGDSDEKRPLTQKQRAELLRRMVDTIGKPGEPGAKIHHVISVAMLSEGWDAKTVTHIMGLRAFTSQLLCEQVVGRGLRRTSYEIANPIEGTFAPEYVNVFGVPFSFMPHEEEGGSASPPEPTIRIEAVPERAANFELTWPQVIRIEHVLTPKLQLDLSRVPVLPIDAATIAHIAELAPTVDNRAEVSLVKEIDLRELADRFRYQKIVFEAARKLFEAERPAWTGNDDFLLGQLIQIVERFVRSDRIQISPPLFYQNELHRRVVLALSMPNIVQHLKMAIRASNTQSRRLVLDDHRPIRSTGDMTPWYTSKPTDLTSRSHINRCVFDGTWEAAEAHSLDSRDTAEWVRAWAKNDHLGFEIRYILHGGVSKYRPDFLIRLRDGRTLILEVKGQETPRDVAKRAALTEWVEAVNTDGRFGQWCSSLSSRPGAVLDILKRHCEPAAVERAGKG